jgi:hypothetical protein
VEVTPSGDERYQLGQRLRFKLSEYCPLTPREFWSAFDDYYELQKSIGRHGAVIQETESGQPLNGIGASIVLKSPTVGETREILSYKDDVNKLWKIDVPQPY